MNTKNQTRSQGHGFGAFLILPVFWFFILLLLFKLIYPFINVSVDTQPVYSIAAIMFLFALIAPFVHNIFYQVSYGKMAFLWIIFTTIGFLRLESSTQSQSLIIFHLLSWQLPAIVFSLIYTLLYAKNKNLKIEIADSNLS